MTEPPFIRRVAVIGGGTAGWMSAAALARLFGPALSITLVESDAIGTVGVGEATIPSITTFHRMLGIDEDAFLRASGGTFKLGIEFADWARIGDRYWHPFGKLGRNVAGVPFQPLWQRLEALGEGGRLEDYALAAVAGEAGRFMRPIANGDSPLSDISYAYHFDAGRYARFLRDFAEACGVVRREGRVVRVEREPARGHIAAVVLESGERVEAELFLDCTGFRSLLLGETLGTGWEDWSHWLPCDRAVAVASETSTFMPPFTRATARAAGWQWRIPLQHRTGNGHVFSSAAMSEDEATALLLANLEGPPIGEPRTISFRAGRRDAFWIGNCVAIGLSAGFLEPLESTAIWLIQSALSRLVTLFPDSRFDAAAPARFNRLMARDYEQIRDFIILHYHGTERDDSAFWRRCRTMPVPDSLQEKMRQYRTAGRTFRDDDELFNENSWFAVMNGQRLQPERYDPRADTVPIEEVRARLAEVRDVVATSAAYMPLHRDFLARVGVTTR
jgi:tryptophan halogenase